MKKIIGKIRAAIEKYDMIENGDKIAVGLSGGKDSLVLLKALSELKMYLPEKFELIAISLDPCFFNKEQDFSKIETFCKSLNVPLKIVRINLYQIIFEIRKEKNPCSLCAKMRRGILHTTAKEEGCNKIALGHNLEDVAETFLMNLFDCGKISCFSPKTYLSNKNIFAIRPLIFCSENKIINVAQRLCLPVLKSTCPIDGKTNRKKTRELLKSLENRYKNLIPKILKALQNSTIDKW